MRLVLKRGKILLFLLGMFFATNSCDSIQDSQVPDIPFSFTINLINQNELTIPGNSMYFPGPGFGGVIVFCETTDKYYAYDATCTYEISQTCKVVVEGNITGECGCCNSIYFFNGGIVAQGPAAAPLRPYNVSKVNSFTLRVYN